MLNTLGVRSAIGSRRKLSFRNVSNVVMQLLHTIKFSEPVPFSNIATGSFPSAAAALGGGVARGSSADAATASVQVSEKGSRKVSVCSLFSASSLSLSLSINTCIYSILYSLYSVHSRLCREFRLRTRCSFSSRCSVLIACPIYRGLRGGLLLVSFSF